MVSERTAVEELVRLLDHVLEETQAEFGYDHWHSITWNLANVRDRDWTRTLTPDGRTIRELVVHVGKTYLLHHDSAFGDGTRSRSDETIDGRGPGTTPVETIVWFRAAHATFRDSVAELTDDQLAEPRRVLWGDLLPTRRLVELMIQHTLYHTGEINLIRSVLQGNDDWHHQDMGR